MQVRLSREYEREGEHEREGEGGGEGEGKSGGEGKLMEFKSLTLNSGPTILGSRSILPRKPKVSRPRTSLIRSESSCEMSGEARLRITRW